MEPSSRDYPQRARESLESTPSVREAVTAATLTFEAQRRHAWDEIDASAYRSWAEAVKNHALTNLAELLETAEARLLSRGARVHWAETSLDVHQIVRGIVARRAARTVVKGKSMISEELGINELLLGMGVEVFETDLGEYIIQLLDEPPSHIVGPAIHRSLDEVRALFHERLATELEATPEVLAGAAREVLRAAFLSADVGITGGNFLVAETGSLVLMENEGNIRLTTSLPRVHVALVGIEKVLPHWDDVSGFLELTARSATGQPVTTFVSLIQGPAAEETDGPEELHVVLVDNGRTRVLADPDMWEALRCVRCGACLNSCPVYRQTGGHAYGWVYSGPIGAILAPGLLGMEEGGALPWASSLCGACAEACPVRIPIPKLLLEWRSRLVEAGLSPLSERLMLSAFTAVAQRPHLFRAAGRSVRSLPVLKAPLPAVQGWTRVREAPDPGKRTFHELWAEGIE